MDATPMRRQLQARVTAVGKAARRGLLLGGEHLRGVSQRYVPLEEGTLQNTAKVTVSGDGLTVAVSYGTVYAVRQHEELHWKHDAGRKAKYLEDPMNTEQTTILRLIRQEARSEMER